MTEHFFFAKCLERIVKETPDYMNASINVKSNCIEVKAGKDTFIFHFNEKGNLEGLGK